MTARMHGDFFYREGYRFQMVQDCTFWLPFGPPETIITAWILFETNGHLTLKAGYAWNGANRPAINNHTIIAGSAVHDALYQLIRERKLDPSWREKADEVLRKVCLGDGMWSVRADWVYHGVRIGGGPSADPANDRPILTAP